MIIVAPDGTEVDCFVTGDGLNYVDAILRANTQADWEAAALAADILEEVTQDDGTTALLPVFGNYISAIVPMVITPGIYDDDGNELTPAVIDSRYHVNLRVCQPALSKVDENGYEKWKGVVLTWMAQGEDDANSNASEIGKKFSGVTLIDPSTINTLKRTWL